MRNLKSAVISRIVLALVAVLVAPAAAGAADPFAITSFDGGATDVSGAPLTQAGAHPDLKTSFLFAVTDINGYGQHDRIKPLGSVKDTTVDLPAGLVGNPIALPQCANDDLDTAYLVALCPTDSQVGMATLYGSQFSGAPDQTGRKLAQAPIYNMVPSPGEPAQFAFNAAGVLVRISPSLRPDGNYAVSATVRNSSHSVPIDGASITLWGVPGDAAHDAERLDTIKLSQGAPSHLGRRPLITNPVSCTGPLTVSMRANTWQFPDSYATASFVSHDNETPANPIGVTGCEKLSFGPSLEAVPSTRQPDAPSGLTVGLGFSQNESPDGLATAQLRDAEVTLPEGMTINPAAAGGLQACTDEQIALGTYKPVECPEASKVGEATATTPLLKESLGGSVYIGSQKSSDPASGEMFRVFLRLLDEDRGIDVRLPGKVRVDPGTGRIVAQFRDNPQVPVSDIKLTFKSGPRAPLVTPPACGTKAINAELTSWSGQSATRSSSFDVACTAGLGGFAPSLTAGTATATAGAFSPFAVSITKPDGNAAVDGLTMSLPTGLLAKLKGNLNTQVGTVTAFAGPGSNPFALPGEVFLEGAYGDAPFSLRVEVPAKAGPFDLGTVEVRQKIYVDPIDAHVTVVSDPIPTIVKGVPVRLQRLDVSVDKPGFIVNPTSCAAKAFGGTLRSAAGQSAPINVRFQVDHCSSLALKPKLALTLSGKGQTTDGKHPAVSAVLTQPQTGGQANLKKVVVALPLSLALDPDNAASDSLCSFVEGSKPDPKCPASSVVGKATAVSPILNQPLTGPVYFTKNERKDPKSGRSIKTTPKLVIPLVGENGVKLTLTGTSTVVDDQLVTTFDNIPDAQVSSFKMDITGGKKGILVVSAADICKSTQIADQQIDGQNNKQAVADVFIQTPSCPTKIISKKITAKSVVLKIGGLGAGMVTVTGRGIRKTTKTITKSTVATITAKRTGKAKPGSFKVKFVRAKLS